MRRPISNLICPLVWTLAACLLAGNADAKEPSPAEAKPDSRANGAASSSGSLSLRDCFRLARARSETIAIRKEEIAQTAADFLSATSEALGDVNFLITDTRQDAPRDGVAGDSSSVGSTLSAYDRRERKFVVEQPLFQGFKSLGALMGAGSLRHQRIHEKNRAEELLFLDVAKVFYSVLREKRNVETIENIDALFEERIGELAKREEIGRSRPSEIATAEARRRKLEADLARAQGDLAIAARTLEFLIGAPADLSTLADHPQDFSALSLAQALSNGVGKRANVQASNLALKTAWNGVIVAQGDLWPKISLTNNQYVKREGFQKDIDWDLLFKVDVPLFRGGETAGKVKKAWSVWKKAKLSYSLTKRQAELEIKKNYENWAASRRQYESLEKAVKASEKNFRLQKEDYERNLVNNLDVLEALESLNSARRDSNAAYYQMREAYWQLEAAMGRIGKERL